MPKDPTRPNGPLSEDLSTVGLAHGRRSGTIVRVIEDEVVSARELPNEGDVIIGRSSDATLRIDHGSISRKHAVLHLGSTTTIEDLGSANGTRVRGGRLAKGERVEVRPGDIIEVGSVMLALQRESAPAASREPSDDAWESPVMAQLRALVERVAAGTISVLVSGETGVGKERMAETVHRLSPRAKKPFLRLNCAALASTLLESELFGYERGAFTGADRAKPGLLETAHGGTVFLDEVGELTLGLQAKLLRVLEERAVLRVGALAPIPIDVRFVAATNRDLESEVARGAFRSDLFFRLNGFSIVIPPLRERRSEILPLARKFANDVAASLGRPCAPALGADAVALLEAHYWPGNIRELRNVIERAVLLCAADTIRAEHLPGEKMHGHPPAGSPEDVLRQQLEQVERDRILGVLAQCAGNQTQAAKVLGISRGTLVSRLSAFGVPRPRKK
jgi:two-component system, NtrC family, response regulator AtoC